MARTIICSDASDSEAQVDNDHFVDYDVHEANTAWHMGGTQRRGVVWSESLGVGVQQGRPLGGVDDPDIGEVKQRKEEGEAKQSWLVDL